MRVTARRTLRTGRYTLTLLMSLVVQTDCLRCLWLTVFTMVLQFTSSTWPLGP
jgi:hypothetical protein